MTEQTTAANESAARPWYAKPGGVTVLTYRINRRPLPATLFTDPDDPPPPFLDHLTETLLFGEVVTTVGRGHERRWRLGNRLIDEQRGFLAGWIGYSADDAEEQDTYDDDAAEWTTEVVETERRRTAPFVVIAETRELLIARHPTFSEGVIPVVFEALLTRGENARENPTTAWAVEPVLDERDFERWLHDVAVLDRVSFHVRLPNPDAEDSFRQIAEHLATMEAASLDHRLTPRDPDRGLNKDLDADPITQGLKEMAKRAFATVKAVGKSAQGAVRTYDQKRRVRHETVVLPTEQDAARDRLISEGLDRPAQEGT